MLPKIKNVLFDFDGTLFDTQKLHSQVESELLCAQGIVISPPEITKRYSGVRTEEFFGELLGDQNLANSLVEEKWEVLFQRFGEAKELSNLTQLFSFLQSKNIMFGIGTASPRKWVEDILSEKNLIHFFDRDSIIGGDIVEKGKPDPETWLRLRKNIPPEECIVIEDGVAGAVAAVTVGMHCAVLGESNVRFPKEVVFIKSLDLLPSMFPM